MFQPQIQIPNGNNSTFQMVWNPNPTYSMTLLSVYRSCQTPTSIRNESTTVTTVTWLWLLPCRLRLPLRDRWKINLLHIHNSAAKTYSHSQHADSGSWHSSPSTPSLKYKAYSQQDFRRHVPIYTVYEWLILDPDVTANHLCKDNWTWRQITIWSPVSDKQLFYDW